MIFNVTDQGCLTNEQPFRLCHKDANLSYPVFRHCIISNASPPLTSPTMIRSGRIRNDVLIRSLMVISLHSSTLAFRVSMRTRLGIPEICNSALSSMVMIRSSFGM